MRELGAPSRTLASASDAYRCILCAPKRRGWLERAEMRCVHARDRFFSPLLLLRAGLPRAEELRVVGGGSSNPLWRRIIADSFQARAVRDRLARSQCCAAHHLGAVRRCRLADLRCNHARSPAAQVRLRFPLEPEAAALGGALQAAAIVEVSAAAGAVCCPAS